MFYCKVSYNALFECNSHVVSFAGIVSGQPTLHPAPFLFVCPTMDLIELTCDDNGVHSMQLISGPYIPANNPIIFVPGQIEAGSYPVYHRGPFVAFLESLTRHSGTIHVADLVVDLSVSTSEVGNGTSIMCRTYRGNKYSQTYTTLYFAGLQGE